MTFSILVPIRYAWADAPPIVREYAEKVDFPKDRDIIARCFFLVIRSISVSHFFISENSEDRGLESILIDFDDFPEIDFMPLYEFVAQDAKTHLAKRGYDVTGFHYTPCEST